MNETPSEEAFDLSAGALCLDLANTLADRPRGSEEELETYADLLRWARQAGIVSAEEAEALAAAAADRPAAADRVLATALDLRETIYRIFAHRSRGEEADPDDLGALNAALQEALPRLEVTCGDGCGSWQWGGDPEDLARLLWPVPRSAADLLTSEEGERVRECAAETCSWLFVDRSRNRRRKWCDMSTCGNRAKARRHYHRQKRRRSG